MKKKVGVSKSAVKSIAKKVVKSIENTSNEFEFKSINFKVVNFKIDDLISEGQVEVLELCFFKPRDAERFKASLQTLLHKKEINWSFRQLYNKVYLKELYLESVLTKKVGNTTYRLYKFSHMNTLEDSDVVYITVEYLQIEGQYMMYPGNITIR